MIMAMVLVKCPNCGDTKVEKAGKQPNGTQRYRCCNELCSRTIFQLEYKYNAYYPDIKMKILEMAINGSGIRDTARVLKISTDTVIDVLKKRNFAQ